MAPQLGAPSGEAGYEDGAGDDALPPVSGRESTTKQWRSATACALTAHAFLCSVLRRYHDRSICYSPAHLLRTRSCVVCCVIITTKYHSDMKINTHLFNLDLHPFLIP